MTTEPEPGAPRRKFVVSVKHPDGDWGTYEALEILLTGPIEVTSSVSGLIRITAGAGYPEDTRPPDTASAR